MNVAVIWLGVMFEINLVRLVSTGQLPPLDSTKTVREVAALIGAPDKTDWATSATYGNVEFAFIRRRLYCIRIQYPLNVRGGQSEMAMDCRFNWNLGPFVSFADLPTIKTSNVEFADLELEEYWEKGIGLNEKAVVTQSNAILYFNQLEENSPKVLTLLVVPIEISEVADHRGN